MKKLLGSTALTLLLASGAAHADIVSTVDLTEIAAPSVTVTDNFLSANGLPGQVIWAEQQDVVLGSALNTDTGAIASGTIVDSYFVAFNIFDPLINFNSNATVTFDGPVLGVVWQGNFFTSLPSANFATTDFLGLANTKYAESGCPYCAFEQFPIIQQGFTFDNVFVGNNSVNFVNAYSNPGDFARILVAPASVPAPIAGAGLPAMLLAGFLAWRRRRAT